ncbi:MAG TPA: hypothetical protein VD815_00120 [Candidatus Saccharimonadales bacterium]|nr:hypothetical protein [Candidatus Saccharimonadales bacterium]
MIKYLSIAKSNNHQIRSVQEVMPDVFRNRLKRYNGICDIVMGLITTG